jgi:hypothetical protein
LSQEIDPALCFLSLLRAALAGGRAHAADRAGKKPEEPAFLGLAAQANRAGVGRERCPHRLGHGELSLLGSNVSYQTVQQIGGPSAFD